MACIAETRWFGKLNRGHVAIHDPERDEGDFAVLAFQSEGKK
jgi:hypothetical protein